MRVLIAVLVLIFSLQSWTKADDISDFEIEGMSIGDSLLDFYSEREINNFYNYDHLPSDMKFMIADDQRTTGSYDGLQFFYKPKDQKFSITFFPKPSILNASFETKCFSFSFAVKVHS